MTMRHEEVVRMAGLERLPRHCHNKKKENGWPRPQPAERKTCSYNIIQGARKREKKDGRPNKKWRNTFQEDL